LHPGTCGCTGAAVAFIHQYQVIAFKGFNGNRFIAHAVTKLVDVDYLDGAFKRVGSVLIEEATETET
jgi:hypothetical protein